MRRSFVLFGVMALVVSLAIPASAQQLYRGHDLTVSFSNVDYEEADSGHMTVDVDILGVWDDTDIVHITGTARFRFARVGQHYRIGSIEFIGTATTSTAASFQVKGRIYGVFIDDIIIGAHDPSWSGARGLLLPAVQ